MGPLGRRWALAAIGVVLALAVTGLVVHRVGTHPRRAPLTVGWGGSEGRSPCVYDERDRSVTATVSVDGTPARATTLTVTVTAYADENTSVPVGSGSRSLRVGGSTQHRSLAVTFGVTRAPQVGEDDVAACRLAVERRPVRED